MQPKQNVRFLCIDGGNQGYALVWISEHICEKYENDCRDNMGISTSTDENREMYMVLFVMLGNSQTLVEKE